MAFRQEEGHGWFHTQFCAVAQVWTFCSVLAGVFVPQSMIANGKGIVHALFLKVLPECQFGLG